MLSRFSRVRLCATPQTATHQALPSLGFSRQEYWSGLPFPSPMHEREKWKWSCSVVSDPQWPHGLQPTRLLRPWDFPGKSTGVGCHCLLQIMRWALCKSSSSVRSLSCVWLFEIPWTAAHQAFLSFTMSQNLLKLMSIESVMPSTHLIICRSLLLLSRIRVFSNELALPIRWPKNFSFIISPSSEYSGLISFRIDWFDLLEVQGTLESSQIPQLKSINSSAVRYSAFFVVQLSMGKP